MGVGSVTLKPTFACVDAAETAKPTMKTAKGRSNLALFRHGVTAFEVLSAPGQIDSTTDTGCCFEHEHPEHKATRHHAGSTCSKREWRPEDAAEVSADMGPH
jgi:hypothetical protein